MANIIRAWRNLVRIPGRTLLIMLVLVVVSALSVVGFAVEQGAQAAVAGVRQSLGSQVSLVPNTAALRQAMLDGIRSGKPPSPDLMNSLQPVLESQAAQLAGSSYVVAFDKQQTGAGYSDDLTPVTTEGGATFYTAGGTVSGSGGPGPASFRIVGDSYPEMAGGFAAGDQEIISGRLYTEDEVAQRAKVAVIDELLAEQNDLSVGSTFSLSAATDDGSPSAGSVFTVVGISRNSSTADNGLGMAFLNASNTIYVPYTAAQDLAGVTGTISAGVYLLDDPLHIEAFRQEAAQMGIDLDKYALDANDQAFQATAGPLESLAGFAKAGIIAVAVAGALIIGLLMTIATRERRLEIGILRSLGARRRTISAQFLIETLSVCAVALVVGCALGALIAQGSADYLLARQVASAAGPVGLGGAGPVIIGMNGQTMVGGQTAASTPNVVAAIGWRALGATVGIGTLLALAGSLVSAFWVMKVEAMEILAGRS